MKVLDIKHVEDCFDGSLIKEVLLSESVVKDQIFSIGKGGYVQYFPDFPRPFYKIRIDGLFDIKGIEGNRTMRVHIKAPEEYPLGKFIEYLSSID